jgi:hypothetical protein
VNEFAASKGVPVPTVRDSITALYERSVKDCVTADDVLLVAAHLQEALADARLLRLPADVLFDLISAADPESYDQKALLDFILRLLERRPSSAVALILSLNFCLLAPQQRAEIFGVKSLHRNNLNGEVACGLSTARNLAHFELENDFGRLLLQLEAIGKKLEGEAEERIAAVKKAVDAQTEKTAALIAANGERIKALTEKIQSEADEFKKEREAQEAEIQRLRNELDALSEVAATSRKQLDDQQSIIRSTISQALGPFASIDDQLVPEDDLDAYSQRVQQILTERANIDPLFEAMKVMQKKSKALAIDVSRLKSRLFVKIIRDKLNFGAYIRHTDARFGMLTDTPSVWNVTLSEATEAEKDLLEFEEQLDRLCPIRDLTPSAPPSPSSRITAGSRTRTPPDSPSRDPDT